MAGHYTDRIMKVLGIESSCDETGVALVETADSGVPILRAHALHSQVQLHEAYGGVVPELASRDHIRRVLPLTAQVLEQAGCRLRDLDVVAYTRGPGLAGALLVGAGVACGLAAALGLPTLGVHHLEGHLLSPFLSADPPAFPFVALLVSGGHTQLMRVQGVGEYELLGETIDDAAGEAFDKSAKLLGLGYPGGPALAALAAHGDPAAYALPRPLLHSGDVDFSFAGLKTAVLTQVRRLGDAPSEMQRANLAASTQAAIVEVLVKKSLAALKNTDLARLVVSGGVGANRLAAPATGLRLRTPAGAGALPGVGPVHRQRRHDRAGRSDAPAGRAQSGGARLRLRRAAALAAGRYRLTPSRMPERGAGTTRCGCTGAGLLECTTLRSVWRSHLPLQ
jgi:N6-L-threonylcarbamoyladenine synthase